jgi:hypothetical protein
MGNGLNTFLGSAGGEPINNTPLVVVFLTEARALHQAVIQRNILSCPSISRGDQSGSVAICINPLLTVTTSAWLMGLNVWQFLEQVWIPPLLSTTDRFKSGLRAAIRVAWAWGSSRAPYRQRIESNMYSSLP